MKWTAEEEIFLLENISKSLTELTDLFRTKWQKKSMGFPSIRTTNAIRSKINRDKITQTKENPYDDAWVNVIKTAKEYRSKSQHLDLGLTDSKERKIVTFSDLHIPFFLWEDMRVALSEHRDANYIVLNGDSLDAYIFSTFSKSKRVAALKEYNAAFDLVHFLSDNFENI